MALKHLEINEMVGLTGSWVGARRPLILAIPQIAAWLPQLDAVHARVVKAQPVSATALNAEVAEISAKEAELDGRHDGLIRASVLRLEAEQSFCRATEPARLERAELCERAQSTLFPKGLTIINALYVAEAGYAARTRELLASEAWLRELLASVPVSEGVSLLSVVEAWCAIGEQLGQLEEKKAAVLARIASAPQPPRAEIVAARNAWLALVNMILASLALVEGHEEAIETLRSPVLRTAETAGKRGGAGDRVQEEDESPAAPATPAAPAAPGKPGAADEIEPGMPGAKPFL